MPRNRNESAWRVEVVPTLSRRPLGQRWPDCTPEPHCEGDHVSDAYPELIDPAFWRSPLADRMARFAELREIAPFLPATFVNPMVGFEETFHVTTRYSDVIEISRRPQDFCSGRGAVSIPDMPADAMEFFGSFISMDDPRHARQRGIVARSFTPKQLQSVLDSVETICARSRRPDV